MAIPGVNNNKEFPRPQEHKNYTDDYSCWLKALPEPICSLSNWVWKNLTGLYNAIADTITAIYRWVVGEEETAASTVVTVTTIAPPVPTPPPVRPSSPTQGTLSVGIRNIGNSCYLNSTLQAIVHSPALVANIDKIEKTKSQKILETLKKYLSDQIDMKACKKQLEEIQWETRLILP